MDTPWFLPQLLGSERPFRVHIFMHRRGYNSKSGSSSDDGPMIILVGKKMSA